MKPLIELTVNRLNTTALVDTGSECTLVKKEFADSIISLGLSEVRRSNKVLNSVTGNELINFGKIKLDFKFQNKTYQHEAVIVDVDSFGGHLLIGTDLLKRLGQIEFDFQEKFVNIKNQAFPFLECPTENNGYKLMNVKNIGKQEISFTVRKTYVLDSNAVLLTSVPVNYHDNTNVWVESEDKVDGITIANTFARVSDGKIPVALINHGDTKLVGNINLKVSKLDINDNLELNPEIPEYGAPDLTHLEEYQRNAITSLLENNVSAFSQHEEDIGLCTLLEHTIDTGDHKPIVTRQWPLPYSMKKLMEEQCEQMVRMGVIEECQSPWRSPTLLVRKKDNSYRYVIDFRNINKITVRDTYPMPNTHEILESLRGAKYFSTLDAKKGYWQVGIKEADRNKTAFACSGKTYSYRSMAMGMVGASSTFMRLMTNILHPVLGKCAQVYLDDVIVYSPSFEQHIKDLQIVLDLITKANLKLSPEKSKFAHQTLKYLGHVVAHDGIRVDPEKTRAMQLLSPPKTPKQVRAFIGLTSYYRRFIDKFSQVAAPLTELTKKNRKFSWQTQHQTAFETLKKLLCNAPVLNYPDFEKPFVLNTDASDIAIGAVLSQNINGENHAIGYFSQKLSNCERNYSTTEKEALAIVKSVKHFNAYLFGHKFTVRTDHAPLRFLFSQKNTVQRITRWALVLAEYDYEIEYLKGTENVVADPLSRSVAVITQRKEGVFNAADIFNPSTTRTAQLKDPSWQHILVAIENNQVGNLDPKLLEQYTLEEGCLYMIENPDKEEDKPIKLRLCVPADLTIHALKLCHDVSISGHYGITKTLQRAKELFYWPKMNVQIKHHVQTCLTCQRRNWQGATKAKIKSLPPVYRPLQRVGMDLIGKISPSYNDNKYILTIVCHFSRYVCAYALPDKKADTIAKKFLEYVCIYGVPETVVTDRGTEFTAEVFRTILDLLQAKLSCTTAFHPQCNGMTESFNRLITTTIKSMIDEDVRSWDEQLPCTVMALNSSYHPSIRNTPYFLFHGRDQVLPYSSLLNRQVSHYDMTEESPQTVFRRLQNAFRAANEASNKAHDLNVKYGKSKETTYNLGELVFLKNHKKQRAPYSKFLPNWIGPFRIVKIFNDVNVQIDEIYGNRSRPQRVHIDRLKKVKQRDETPYINVLPDSDISESYHGSSEDQIIPHHLMKPPNNNNVVSSDSEDDGITIINKPKNPVTGYALRSRGPPVPQAPLPARTRRKILPLVAIITIAVIHVILSLI